MAYPAPAFLSQAAYYEAATNTSTVVVTFDRSSDAGAPLVLLDNSTVSCPDGTPASNCTGLEIMGSDGGLYAVDSQALTAGNTLTLAARLPAGVYGYGSASAWSMWPRVLLYGGGGLPVLPWKQGLSMGGVPPPPPSSAAAAAEAAAAASSSSRHERVAQWPADAAASVAASLRERTG
jgi:hypothetical protein